MAGTAANESVTRCIACDSIVACFVLFRSHGSQCPLLLLMTARVPPVGGGDVNRDWEGCRKGKWKTVPRIEEKEMEEEIVRVKRMEETRREDVASTS